MILDQKLGVIGSHEGSFLGGFNLKGLKGGYPQFFSSIFVVNVTKLKDRKSDHKTFQYI